MLPPAPILTLQRSIFRSLFWLHCSLAIVPLTRGWWSSWQSIAARLEMHTNTLVYKEVLVLIVLTAPSLCSSPPTPPPPATSTTQITLESQSTGNGSHLSVTKEADRTGKQQVICTWWGGHSWETNRWATTWIWAILRGKQNCMRNTQIIKGIGLNSLASSCWADRGPETLHYSNIWLWES